MFQISVYSEALRYKNRSTVVFPLDLLQMRFWKVGPNRWGEIENRWGCLATISLHQPAECITDQLLWQKITTKGENVSIVLHISFSLLKHINTKDLQKKTLLPTSHIFELTVRTHDPGEVMCLYRAEESLKII